MKRSPMKARRTTPRRRTAPEWTFEEWEAATHVLNVRANGLCERCGQKPWTNRHHRQRRRDGGDTFPNLLLLCGTGTTGCHGWITTHPAEAEAQGWIVPTWDDPAAVPVRLPDGYLWILRDDGTKQPAP